MPSIESLKELPLLIIPEGDITHAHEGESMNLTVYFEGKPLANVEVIGDYVNSGKVVAKTDESGKATIPVRNNGLNVIAVNHSVEMTGDEKEKADKIGYTSTLSFSNDHHED